MVTENGVLEDELLEVDVENTNILIWPSGMLDSGGI